MLQTFYENYEIFRLHFGNLNGYRTIIWNSWMATNCFAATQTIPIDKYWLYSNVHWNALDENYGDWKVTTLSMNTVVLCRAIQFSTWVREKVFIFDVKCFDIDLRFDFDPSGYLILLCWENKQKQTFFP